MKNFIIVFFILLISSCSSLIDRTAKYSEFSKTPNYTRDQIIAVLGEPDKSIENSLYTEDYYQVEGRVYDSYAEYGKGMGEVMTLGLIELIATPVSIWEVIAQKAHPTKKTLLIRYSRNIYVYQRVLKNL